MADRRGRAPGPVPRGVCPDCGNDYHLRGNNTMGQHQRRTRQGYQVGDCPGVGKPPRKPAPTVAAETCRTYQVDGEPVVVRGDREFDEQDQAALAEVVRATREHVERTDPHGGVLQELHAAVRLATHCIPDGAIRAGVLGERDGAVVKQRLKDAAAAARAAMEQDSAWLRHHADASAAIVSAFAVPPALVGVHEVALTDLGGLFAARCTCGAQTTDDEESARTWKAQHEYSNRDQAEADVDDPPDLPERCVDCHASSEQWCSCPDGYNPVRVI